MPLTPSDLGRCGSSWYSHGVLHEVVVVTVREVLAEVAAAGFLAVQGRHGHDLGHVQQEAELHGLEQVKVEPLALVLDARRCS